MPPSSNEPYCPFAPYADNMTRSLVPRPGGKCAGWLNIGTLSVLLETWRPAALAERLLLPGMRLEEDGITTIK